MDRCSPVERLPGRDARRQYCRDERRRHDTLERESEGELATVRRGTPRAAGRRLNRHRRQAASARRGLGRRRRGDRRGGRPSRGRAKSPRGPSRGAGGSPTPLDGPSGSRADWSVGGRSGRQERRRVSSAGALDEHGSRHETEGRAGRAAAGGSRTPPRIRSGCERPAGALLSECDRGGDHRRDPAQRAEERRGSVRIGFLL